jgi:hypothetical protein
MNRPHLVAACAAAVVVGIVTIASSQNPPALPVASPGLPAGAAAQNAEREKIWNSPTMLRARAWVQEYCQTSAKITPQEAQQYMSELANLSPAQMKLWLLKFDAEEAALRRQQADFERVRQAGVSQAMSYQTQTAQELADVNRDENEAAENAQQSLNAQQQEAQQRELQNTADRDATETGILSPFGYGPYGPYGAMGGGPYYGGYGGYGSHVHIHVHPQ